MCNFLKQECRHKYVTETDLVPHSHFGQCDFIEGHSSVSGFLSNPDTFAKLLKYGQFIKQTLSLIHHFQDILPCFFD